jgi:prepilin-type N-terminal cleavage/methylation domain-containing protein
MSRGSGFSLVELVAVILILSVLAGAIGSRLISLDTYQGVLFENGLISLIRNTQLAAFGKTNVAVTISYDGATFTASSVESGVSTATISFADDQVALSLGIVNSVGSNPCSPIAAGESFTLNFNSSAEISHSLGLQICINSVEAVCVSPAGFAHEGPCV